MLSWNIKRTICILTSNIFETSVVGDWLLLMWLHIRYWRMYFRMDKIVDMYFWSLDKLFCMSYLYKWNMSNSGSLNYIYKKISGYKKTLTHFMKIFKLSLVLIIQSCHRLYLAYMLICRLFSQILHNYKFNMMLMLNLWTSSSSSTRLWNLLRLTTIEYYGVKWNLLKKVANEQLQKQFFVSI